MRTTFSQIAADSRAVAHALGDPRLAGWIFAHTHRRALATGQIAPHGAETVGRGCAAPSHTMPSAGARRLETREH